MGDETKKDKNGFEERANEPQTIGELGAKVAKSWEERYLRSMPTPINPRADEERAAEALKAAIGSLRERGVPLVAARIVAADAMKPTEPLQRVKAFMDEQPGTLVLAGGAGCGKSVAAAWAVAGSPKEQYVGPHHDGKRGSWPAEYHKRFVDVTKLARMPKWGEQAEKQMEVYENCALLAIDDVGCEVEDAKETVTAILEGLIVVRHDNELHTIVTTNMTVEKFFERFGGRVRDRVRASGAFTSFEGPSLR